MILEAIRIVADWLDDRDNGVNARLGALEQDTDDPQPPDVVKVLDTTRDGELDQAIPMDWPVLVVSSDTPAGVRGDVATDYRDADRITIAVRYVTGDPDNPEAKREALYTVRVIVKAIRDLMRNDNVASRTRNSVCLIATTGLQYGETFEELETGATIAAVSVDFYARDQSP